jgi:hypothetical protein
LEEIFGKGSRKMLSENGSGSNELCVTLGGRVLLECELRVSWDHVELKMGGWNRAPHFGTLWDTIGGGVPKVYQEIRRGMRAWDTLVHLVHI